MSSSSPAKARPARTPLPRAIAENVECLAIAIVMALILKFFLLEAYKIPTGSMQPTIMGLDEKGVTVFDRVLVNKMVYFLRDPERFEVVVFKMPLSQRQNYIKRLLGLPGESLRIRNGDVYVTPPGESVEEAETVARKPDSVWESVRRRVLPVDPEAPRLDEALHAGGDEAALLGLALAHLGCGIEELREGPGSEERRAQVAFLLRRRSVLEDGAIAELLGVPLSDVPRGRSRAPAGYEELAAAVDASVDLRADSLSLRAGDAAAGVQLSEPVTDGYYHGYSPALLEALGIDDPSDQGNHAVSDLELEASLRPDAAVSEVSLQVRGAHAVHRAVFDREAGEVRLVSVARWTRARDPEDAVVLAQESYPARLPTAESTQVSLRHVDDQLVLVVDGEEIARRPYVSRSPDPRNLRTNVVLACQGGVLEVEEFQVHRDIHYTSEGNHDANHVYRVPEDSFFVMGDNTRRSYDCRQWTLGVYTLRDGTEISGNVLRTLQNDPDANPRVVAQSLRGTRLQFRNVHGQAYEFDQREARGEPERIPYHSVPREFLLGKALAVFWPLPPFAPTWRLRLVR